MSDDARTETTDVETLGEWLALYLGNYTLPANYIAPLYGQTHRDVAAHVGPVIAEDLLASDWLAAHVRSAVEQERAAWAARIEALASRAESGADSWGACSHEWARIAEVRALLTSDSTAALDAVKAEAGRAAGERIAAAIEAVRLVCPDHGIPDCSPMLNGCSVPIRLHARRAEDARIARADQIGGAS